MKKTFLTIRIIVLIVLLAVAIVISVSVGSADLSVVDSIKILLSKIAFLNIDVSDYGNNYKTIIYDVRLPRIILSALVGAALSMAGCAYQGVFRNPLSDPHILGVSSGAALFATIATILCANISFLGLTTTGVFAFAGALITVFFVYLVSRIGKETSVTNMLLTGTAISTMFSAIISLILVFNHDQMVKIYLWTMGSFSSATWEKNLFTAVFVLLCGSILIALSSKLNVLMLGDEDAKGLGMNTRRMKLIIVVTASILVAASVSVSGIIGFVGLIIPHSIRLVSGSDNRKVMPTSALLGAVFLVVCDTIARTVASPTEIPIGIITAIFGAPYFIVLIFTSGKGVKS